MTIRQDRRKCVAILPVLILLSVCQQFCWAFSPPYTQRRTVCSRYFHKSINLRSSPKDDDVEKNVVGDEIQRLLAQAKAIRDTLPPEDDTKRVTPQDNTNVETSLSPYSVMDTDGRPSVDFRLHIDIGKEEGTWMEPRWGASGRRIEFTLDVSFLLANSDDNGDDPSLADAEIVDQMVKDNLSGKSSIVRQLRSAPTARLRGGFDQMKCHGGGYRIDVGKSSTARFFVPVEGTSQGSYGDVSIPKGCLYFSLPCFNNSMRQLSTKEGIVTVRQMGWHTGWRREESRIVGVFRAVPLEQAKKKDKF